MFIGEYGKFNYLTYLGVIFALIAMALTLNGEPTLAMMAFIMSGVCDLFDGRFARQFVRTPQQEQYGIEIDSLSDMVNFVAFPTVMLLTQAFNNYVSVLVVIIYALAATNRLAYFNSSTKVEGHGQYFIGLPVTYSALFFPLLYLLDQWFAMDLFPILSHVMALVLAFLFIWKRPIPKPNGIAYAVFVLLALLTLVGLGFLQW